MKQVVLEDGGALLLVKVLREMDVGIVSGMIHCTNNTAAAAAAYGRENCRNARYNLCGGPKVRTPSPPPPPIFVAVAAAATVRSTTAAGEMVVRLAMTMTRRGGNSRSSNSMTMTMMTPHDERHAVSLSPQFHYHVTSLHQINDGAPLSF